LLLLHECAQCLVDEALVVTSPCVINALAKPL
jgi:hypothetical protein